MKAQHFVVALLLFAASPISMQAQGAPLIPADVSDVTSGGWWSGGGREGSYRIIIQAGGFEHIVSRVWLQWVSGPSEQEDSMRVVASVEIEEINGAGWQANSPRIELRNGKWEATIDGANSHTDPMLKTRWRIALGLPEKFTLTVVPPRSH
jgi:hypothetical protein